MGWLGVHMGMAAALFVGAVASGCGDDDAPADAALDGAGRDGSVAQMPDIPWLADGVPPIAAPELTPCPDGWREVDDGGGGVTCDPYPEGGPADCADGEAHFPGEPGCVSLGAPCPAGEFSEALPADANVVYVQPGATGDGMMPATPRGDLSFSLTTIPRGSVIALSRGAHAGPVRLIRDVVLWGACVGETTLSSNAAARPRA